MGVCEWLWLWLCVCSCICKRRREGGGEGVIGESQKEREMFVILPHTSLLRHQPCFKESV